MGGREKFLNSKIVEVIVRVIIQCQAGINFEGSAPLGHCGPVGSPIPRCLRTTVTLDSRAQGSWLWGPFERPVESHGLLQPGLSVTLCLWFVKHGLEEWGDCLFPLFGETPEIPDDICYSAPRGGRQFFLLLTPGYPRIGEGGQERAYFLVFVVCIYNVFLKYTFLYIIFYIFNILFYICLYIQSIS